MPQVTTLQVENLVPRGTRYEEFFGEGFGVRVGSDGTKTFFYWYRPPAIEGQPRKPNAKRRLTLGRFKPRDDDGPGITLKQALQQHRVARTQVDQGLDPADEKRLARHRQQQAQAEALAAIEAPAYTVRHLFDEWKAVELTRRVHRNGATTGRKDSGSLVQLQFAKHVFPLLGDMPADGVRRADVMRVLDGVRMAGKLRTTNMVLANLRQMFEFGVVREKLAANPTSTIKRKHAGGKDAERTRALSEDELRTLATLLPQAGMAKRTEHVVWLLLATMARIGELVRAEWSHVDLQGKTWLIPAENSKNRQAHLVHLSDFAIEHFEALQRLDAQERTRLSAYLQQPLPRWVLPNRDGTSHVDEKTITKQLTDRQRGSEPQLPGRSARTSALQLPGGRWTAHDLRRTGAMLMGDGRVPGDVIELCLNHLPPTKLERTYQRAERLAERREAFDSLGRHLATLATPTTTKRYQTV